MRASLMVSGFAHVAALVFASVSFPAAKPFEVTPMEALPVEIVSASELTRVQAGERDAPKAEIPVPPAPEKNEEAKKEQPQRVDTPQQTAALPPEPSPPRPQARPEPEQKPEPAPRQTREQPREKADEAKKEQARTPPPLPAPRPAYTPPPTPQPARQERQFKPDEIAALLNKVPDRERPVESSEQEASREATLGHPTGRDSTMSMNEIDALRQQIARCWSPPVGVQGASDMAVRIGMELNQDGSLAGEPQVVSSGSGLSFQVAADAARRAVLRCQPYNLPPEKYDAWRRVNVNFDPRLMLGG